MFNYAVKLLNLDPNVLLRSLLTRSLVSKETQTHCQNRKLTIFSSRSLIVLAIDILVHYFYFGPQWFPTSHPFSDQGVHALSQ